MQNHISVDMRLMGNYAKKGEPVIKRINIVEILSYQVLRELKSMEIESRMVAKRAGRKLSLMSMD